MSEIEIYFHPQSEMEVARYRTHGRRLIACDQPPKVDHSAYWYDHDGLALLSPQFDSLFRLQERDIVHRASGRSELLRACDMNSSRPQSVLDCFAGFGVDAALLAQAGGHVTCYERSVRTWLLLDDFSRRLGLAIEARLGDGRAALTTDAFDVVYLDPMFGARAKTALPPRAAQHLRELAVETDTELATCVHQAQRCARSRVVLKRRPKDPPIGAPNHSVQSKRVRFDVYLALRLKV